MYYFYTTFVYGPLYNGFVLLIGALDSLSWIDAGMIVILFTVIIRIILYPLSRNAAKTQIMMKLIQPELDEIKNKYKTDKQAQAVATMKLYKDKGLKPFSSIFLLFIQLPIIFALYKIFYDTGFSVIHTELLYSWVPVPELVGTNFLGLIDVTKASIIMALLAAASQYFQIHISVPKIAPRKEGAALHEDFARNMQVQMKYIFPVMIFFISWNIASALAIYWTTSNLFMLGQELYIRRQLAKEKPLTTA